MPSRPAASPLDGEGSGRRTLALIAAIAFAFAGVWAFIFLTQKPPVAAGVITGLVAVPVHTELRQGGTAEQGTGGGVVAQDQVMVLVNTTVKNTTGIPLFPFEQKGTLTLPTGEQKRVRAVSTTDMMRAFRAYPALAAAHASISGPMPAPSLPRETTLKPGEAEHGLVLFAFPIKQEEWESRRSFDLDISFRWQRDLEIEPPVAPLQPLSRGSVDRPAAAPRHAWRTPTAPGRTVKLKPVRTCDVVIVGAGIIGLSSALELASHGLSVTVLEQGAAMREASWAAAGMLAVGDPGNAPQLRALSEFSRALYPGFLRRAEQLSGLRVPLRTSETLQGLPPGLHTERGLDAHALRARLPDLVAGGRAFIHLDEESLDPRDLCVALPLAARAAGVTVYEHTEVHAVEPRGARLRVSSSNGDFFAQQTLECTGAWAGGLRFQGAEDADPLPITPRKGQILSVTMPAGAPALDCVVRTAELYLVPRGDGRVVVGATVERAGFDRTVSAEATEALLRDAAALWPPIREGVVAEQWTGLRPATPDGLPILSRLSGCGEERGAGRRWAANGHFRNGILLAPATAHLVRQMMLGEEPEIALDPFRAGRFAVALSSQGPRGDKR